LTYRDASAFTTLDNANEGIMDWQEAYRKWTDTHDIAVRRRMRQDMAFVKTFEKGWGMRQPEIDVLTRMQEEWIKKWFAVAEENATLKAENERLRKDAERYRWLRDPKTDVGLVIDKVVDEIPSEEGTGYDGLKVYEYRAGEELDAAIDAALKDFSTAQSVGASDGCGTVVGYERPVRIEPD
jgi:hypothetical protein